MSNIIKFLLPLSAKSTAYALLFICLYLPLGISAFDNPHFYRATNMFLEPRIEHDFLSTFDATFASGSTHKSRNKEGSLVPLLDIYGTHPITIVDKEPMVVSIGGTFNIREANLFFMQNFLRGFFLFTQLPIRHLKTDQFATVLSKKSAINLRHLLTSLGLNPQPFNATGAGDLTCSLGWTHNYQNTTTLDFIDMTCVLGILAPTGKKKNPDLLFSLPLGYNGHWGVPLSVKLSLGMYEWITLGISTDLLFFLDNTEFLGLKTSTEQSNLILLLHDHVSVKKGFIWDTGVYVKADHFMYGLSFTFAYSYAGEQKTVLTPIDNIKLNKTIINSDQSLKKWNMHTLHFFAEYDFAKQDSKIGPRVGFFYNYQIKGMRTFNTNMCGGSFGIDIAWDM